MCYHDIVIGSFNMEWDTKGTWSWSRTLLSCHQKDWWTTISSPANKVGVDCYVQKEIGNWLTVLVVSLCVLCFRVPCLPLGTIPFTFDLSRLHIWCCKHTSASEKWSDLWAIFLQNSDLGYCQYILLFLIHKIQTLFYDITVQKPNFSSSVSNIIHNSYV